MAAPARLLLLLALAACEAPVEPSDDPATWEGRLPGECADGADNDADGAFDCDDPDCAGSPACEEDPLPEVDCDALPGAPLAQTEVPGARGFHGLAFAPDGALVGSDNLALIEAWADGSSEVWVPGLDRLEQMTFLPGGDLVVSSGDTGGLLRVTPDGGVTTVAPDLHAYSVVLGPDGRIYSGTTLSAASTTIARTDLDTGEVTVLASLPAAIGARGLGFDRTFTRLYAGSAGGVDSGEIYVIELDEDFDAVGDPELLTAGVGGGWLDGVAVDACDNLYVPDSWTLSLYRVSPLGDVERFADWRADEGAYGHDVVFGTGRDGWRDDALYLPRPYGRNRVDELVLGVPSASFEGSVVNRP